jgi:hypothetical protein
MKKAFANDRFLTPNEITRIRNWVFRRGGDPVRAYAIIKRIVLRRNRGRMVCLLKLQKHLACFGIIVA